MRSISQADLTRYALSRGASVELEGGGVLNAKGLRVETAARPEPAALARPTRAGLSGRRGRPRSCA